MRAKAELVPSRFWVSSDFEICVHEFHYVTRGFDALPHTHAEYNITFCLEQKLEYVIEERVEQLGPGDVLIINPGDVHFGRYGEASHHARGVTLHISERALRNVLTQMRIIGEDDARRFSFYGKAHSPGVARMADELVQELDRRQRGWEILVHSLIPQMLVGLFRDALTPSLVPAAREIPRQLPSWQMVQALEYMNSRGKSDFSLAELCVQIGSSPSRFIRLFTNSANASPHTFYNHLLIAKAQNLLLTEQCSIKELAYHLGFQNDGHFCTLFRQVAGTTPKVFRTLEAAQSSPPPVIPES